MYCNKLSLYRTITVTSNLLHQIKGSITNPCSNTVEGTDNVVLGEGNIVLGSRNQVIGYNNWVFVSDYRQCPSGNIQIDEGVLVIGQYRIELSKIALIPRDPRIAISLIDAVGLERLKTQNKAVSYFFS